MPFLLNHVVVVSEVKETKEVEALEVPPVIVSPTVKEELLVTVKVMVLSVKLVGL